MNLVTFPRLNFQDVQLSFVHSVRGKDSLMTYAQFKEKLFSEFEEREIQFQIKHEPMTPFANEEKEIQYIKELKLVGQEQELGASIIDLGNSASSTKYSADEYQKENFFADISVDRTKVNNDTELDESKIETATEIIDVSQSRSQFFSKKTIKQVIKKSSADVSGFDSREESIPTRSNNEVLYLEKDTVTKQNVPSVSQNIDSQTSVPNPSYFEDEDKAKIKELFEDNNVEFTKGMPLREFLRKNPTLSADEVYQYYSKQEVKKALLLGKIVKRGNKLFI